MVELPITDHLISNSGTDREQCEAMQIFFHVEGYGKCGDCKFFVILFLKL